jgi:hypothetical protein
MRCSDARASSGLPRSIRLLGESGTNKAPTTMMSASTAAAARDTLHPQPGIGFVK